MKRQQQHDRRHHAKARRLTAESDHAHLPEKRNDARRRDQFATRIIRALWQYSSDALFVIRISNRRYYAESCNRAQQQALPPELDTRRPLDQIIPAELYKDVKARYDHCVETRAPVTYYEQGINDEYWLTVLVPFVEGLQPIRYIAGLTRNIKPEPFKETLLQLGRPQAAQLPFTEEELNFVVEERVRQRTKELLYEKVQAELLASIDPLTGIPNRRALQEQFAHEWRVAQRHRQTISLAMIDIDHFKNFNDRYGHLKGDWALQQVACIFQNQMRRPRDLAARIGGEEFVVLLPEIGRKDAESLMRKCQNALHELAIPNPTNTSESGLLTISIGGVTCTTAQADNTESVLQIADEMLYLAKNSGRNCICWREL